MQELYERVILLLDQQYQEDKSLNLTALEELGFSYEKHPGNSASDHLSSIYRIMDDEYEIKVVHKVRDRSKTFELRSDSNSVSVVFNRIIREIIDQKKPAYDWLDPR